MDKTTQKKGNIAITLSTFVFIAYDRGVEVQDSQIQALCERISSEASKASLQQVTDLMMDTLPANVALDASVLSQFIATQCADTLQQEDPFELGKELVEVVSNSLGDNPSVEDVLAWLTERIPDIQNGWDISEDESPLQAIRRYEFKRGLPWIAQIAERTDAGLTEMWVMVEKVTDTVLCMDPYPWDDVDEEFILDVPEFLLRWDLAGKTAIHLA